MITTSSFFGFRHFMDSGVENIHRILSRYAVGSTVHYVHFGHLAQPRPEHVRRVELWCRKHCLVTRWAVEKGLSGVTDAWVLVIEFKGPALLQLFRREVSGPEALRETPRFFLRERLVDRELLARAVLLSPNPVIA
jgi:hypothetical protein